jgi:hypothetical protein
LSETLGPAAKRSRPRQLFSGWSRKPRPFPLRARAARYFHEEALQRCQLEGSLLLLMAETALELRAPWQTLRHEALRRLSGLPADSRPLRRGGARWQARLASYAQEGARLLEQLRSWRDSAPAHLAEALLAGGDSNDQQVQAAQGRKECLEHWSRQIQAVRAALQLELDLREVGRQLAAETGRLLESMESDYRGLVEELDGAVERLDETMAQESAKAFPDPRTLPVTAEARFTAWEREVAGAARIHLLEAQEIAPLVSPLPEGKTGWRLLRPQAEMLAALEGPVRAAVREGLEQTQNALTAVVWEIERARQVVRFGQEAAEREGSGGLQLAHEAAANARSLLRYQRKALVNPCAEAEKTFVEGVSAGLLRPLIVLELKQLGVWGRLVRWGSPRAALEAWQLARPALRRFSNAMHGAVRILGRRLLEFFWRGPRPAAREPVVRRAAAPAAAELGASLPLLYEQLFRPEPLTDPRLLVGRSAEMAAFAELRQMWESKRPAGALVIGNLGSGKTSLLNCAISRVFPDVELARGEFRERLGTSDAMRDFLRRLFAHQEQGDPAEAFSAARKVVVLEGLERTFLRDAGGYDALRELLRIVSVTSRSLLWILSTNDASFRLLDTAVRLGEFFTHRIDAVAVTPEEMRAAILLRHNLSGLRLQFAAAPQGERDGFLPNLLGGERSPQERFFETLYRESEGLYRDGFRLWRDHIERADEEVLHMRYIPGPHSQDLGDIPGEHLFTLHAVLQHGGLTPREHATLFHVPEQESRMHLDTLHDRGWVVRDAHRNYQAAPRAQPLIRRTLRRRNLLG